MPLNKPASGIYRPLANLKSLRGGNQLDKRLKIAFARLFHESHSFSPQKTDLDRFKERELYFRDDIYSHYKNTRTEAGAYVDFVERYDIHGFPIIAAAANPSGLVTYDTYIYLKNYIVENLKQLGEIDGLYLSLHGAMVVEGINDPEGDLLTELRRIASDIPIAITLDLHANVSKKTAELSDILVGYKTYPHTDQYDVAERALLLLLKYINGEIQPKNYFKKLPIMLPSMNMLTNNGPMAELINEAKRYEKIQDIFNISIFGGYPYSDIEDVGVSIVVTAMENNRTAEDIILHLSKLIQEKKGEFLVRIPKPKEAIEEAMREKLWPTALVDVADNPGSGGSADTTLLLRTLIDLNVKGVAFAFISDPESVDKAIKNGVGQKVKLNLGGKTSKLYGEPVKIEGIVKTITDGIYYNKGPWATGLKVNFGRTVVVSTDTIDIIITEGCQSPNDPQIFRRNGLEPTDYKILAMKAKNHFRVGFQDIIKKVIPVDAPGVASLDLTKFPYKNIPRPIWPLDNI